MAFALQPEGVVEEASRPLVVELGHGPARGMTVVDWQRQTGDADNATILMRYEQGGFERMVEAALAAT